MFFWLVGMNYIIITIMTMPDVGTTRMNLPLARARIWWTCVSYLLLLWTCFFASGNLSFGANAKSNWSASAHVRYECQIRGYSGNTGAGDEWEDASELIVMIWVINRIFWELMMWIICLPESSHPRWRGLMSPTACLRCRIILEVKMKSDVNQVFNLELRRNHLRSRRTKSGLSV